MTDIRNKPQNRMKSARGKRAHRDVMKEDEDINSDLENSDGGIAEVSSDEDVKESAQEKRLRLTKKFLAEIKEQEADHVVDKHLDPINERLKLEQEEKYGRLHKDVASNYTPSDASDIQVMRGHQLSVTCLVITPDDKFVISGSKDSSLIKWDISTGKKVKIIHGGRKGTEKTHIGHTEHILSMAITSDGKYLATGDQGRAIYIWDAENLKLLEKLHNHRTSVMGLAFRKSTHQLFSSSSDRTVKLWSIDEMAYCETLFGHEDSVLAVDCLYNDRALTVGGRDRSVRVWKISEESQLVFKGHLGTIDCCALVNETTFITGGDDNTLLLWSVNRKKPICTKRNAHPGEDRGKLESKENWITAISVLQNTDLIATGSKNGEIRLWQCAGDFTRLKLLYAIPMCGFVNSMKFTSDGRYLVAGIGQEHRLGRWWRIKEAKNSVCLIKLHRK